MKILLLNLASRERDGAPPGLPATEEVGGTQPTNHTNPGEGLL